MELIVTADGSHTIFVPELNEQYHSVNGAITESEYVYIDKGFRFCKIINPTVFEVGFGTGLNCLLTLAEVNRSRRHTKYISIEKYLLEKEMIQKLNYESLVPGIFDFWEKIHRAPWNEEIEISEFFTLKKIRADLLDFQFENGDKADVVYFDAFGPDKQPEMWTPAVFSLVYNLTAENGIFVTYSAKGEVRRQLAACGFAMERLPGPPGKIQMLRGIKPMSKI
jgi:tRNA U34 5-methylaminomethyl-2-thiouridine-forming methyltransferase MnmC